jgi:cytochrome c biogenesis protein CcmG/thiol:disulfide interchange protein DsbE
MWKYFAPLVIFGLLILVLMSGLGKDPSLLPSPLIEKAAPQFELPSVNDPTRTIGTANFAGKPTILNVWATWCVGCRQEHGFLMELTESGTIPVYGLNWRDNQAEAQKFLQQLGDPYIDSAYDGDGRVGIDWGVYGAPETFLIGADGTVLYKHLGPLNWALWREYFVPHLEMAGQTQ